MAILVGFHKNEYDFTKTGWISRKLHEWLFWSDFTKIGRISQKLITSCSISTLFTSCSIYTLYKLTLHSDSLFTSYSISTLYKLHLLRVCPGCPQIEQTLDRLCLGSLLGSDVDVLAPVLGSILVQLTRLCPTCVQFEQT